MNPLNRRQFIKTALVATTIGTICSSFVTFAAWPEKAYLKDSVDGVLDELYGTNTVADSDKVSIKSPAIAENGAVVPITIKTSLPNVESISILVKNNPNPLVARFNLGPTSKGKVNTRIKIGESSDVVAVVQSNGKLYRTTNYVKVTIGGCGGG